MQVLRKNQSSKPCHRNIAILRCTFPGMEARHTLSVESSLCFFQLRILPNFEILKESELNHIVIKLAIVQQISISIINLPTNFPMDFYKGRCLLRQCACKSHYHSCLTNGICINQALHSRNFQRLRQWSLVEAYCNILLQSYIFFRFMPRNC